MNTFITTTFSIIITFSLINLLTSISIYFSFKRDIYLRTAMFWFFLIVNFIVQAQAQHNETEIILGFGFSIIPLNLLAYTSLFFSRTQYPKKFIPFITIFSVLLTIALLNEQLSFTLKSLPLALASAAPLLYTVYAFLRKNEEKTTTLMYVHSAVLFFLAIHCFNFSLFRMSPEAQLWGWPIAYGLYQILAMTIPAMLLQFTHMEEKKILEAQVTERTRELLKKRDELELSHKILEKKNRELINLANENQFLLNILVHDISNPIQIMIHFNKKLTYQNIPDELHKFMDSFKKSLASILETLSTVRQYHAVNLGKLVPKLMPIPIILPLRECIDLFDTKLKEKSIELVINYDEVSDVNILADPSWLKNQIFSNIISNAIKFSPAGEKILVSFKQSTNFINIFIRDYGVGISNELKERIFLPNTETTKDGTLGEKGTGLGMPIVKASVEKLDGEIRITDVPSDEKGTCFELKFKIYSKGPI